MTEKEKILQCIRSNNFRQAKLLLDAGCDVNVKDGRGRTALMTSCVYIHEVETRCRLVQLLLHAGADVNAFDKKRKTVLTYACTLNQPNIVECLLKQPGLDANIGDRDGCTALMHAAALGHYNVIQILMAYQRSCSVTIDINAQDDNGNTALDHASVNKGQQYLSTSCDSGKIRHLLESYNENVGGKSRSENSSPTKVIKPTDGIELVDMTRSNVGKKKRSGNPSNADKIQQNAEKKSATTEAESSVDSNPNVLKWAEELKHEHGESGKTSSLLSASSGNFSRPASRLGTGKGSSSLDRLTPSRMNRPQTQGKKTSDKANHLSVEQMSSGEEDEDISLQSLSELVGTVRQYAQEIHEIYAPIQKEKEERTKRKNEKNERKRQKALSKQSSVKSDTPSTGSFQHEVVVEIHKIENDANKADRPKPQGPTHSKSHDPSTAGLPLASLHVENEQLSSTWPRGRQRPRSRDRFRHDMHTHAKDRDAPRNPNIHGSNSSIASAPNPGNFSRPRIPSDWNEGNSLQQERNILNKAFQKLVKSNDDPLLSALNQNKKNFKLQEQLESSRQSVIQLGKSRQQQAKKVDVPSISVIPPPDGEFGHRAMMVPRGQGGTIHGDSAMPSGTFVSHDVTTHTPGKRIGRGEAKTPVNKGSGLRRRKSVDQGMGEQVFHDKY